MRSGVTGDVLAVFGALVATVVVLTLVSGGNLGLGTSPQGPYFNLGFRGPQNR